MIIPVSDLHMPGPDIYGLPEVQLLRMHEPQPGLFIAESELVISRALARGYEPVSMLIEKKYLDNLPGELSDAMSDKPVYVADYETLRSLTGYTLTRGMLCCMRRKELPGPAALCADMRRIVILESAQNPTNVGAIIRSAAALHMDGVILTKGSADPLYRRAARVSMGNVFHIPWTMAPEEDWTKQTMPALRRLGFRFAAMALQGNSLSVADERLRSEDRLAIVLGTEGEGLRPKTIHVCDYTVKIPMAEGVDSLNVAAAGAIAFWEMGRRPDT